MSDIVEIQKKTKMLNLLYVEDDLSSREQLSMILNIFFAKVTVAEDGLSGWELYQKESFDLVITDINMPKMNGIELLKKIRLSNPFQKVIIVSAHDSGEYLLSAIRLGVNNFIIKPVEMEQFEGAISSVSTEIHNAKLKSYYQQELESEVTRKTEEIMKMAVTDELTGLYNRKKLNHMLSQSGEKVLMLLNIDNFDNINATYGYINGDLILQNIALFFETQKHLDATLFRLGHDEFAFLFLDTEITEVEKYAKDIQIIIRKHPIVYEHIIVKFSATIVLAEGKKDLLKDVHVAFKETRTIGKNLIGIYKKNSDMEIHQRNIQNCMHSLHDILDRGDIIPFFQPIINNKTKKIEKYECLARILNDGKIQMPALFLETAALSGMLTKLSRIMIDKSFDYFKDKKEEFSVNISEADLNEGYLGEFLKDAISKYSINPKRVVIEVLEGISANGAKKSLDQLMMIKSMGFQLAIDDFGAENSNFERVYHLSVDYIKIDGQFIKHIDTDPNSYNVAKTITDFSKSIGAKVIAEYVHSEAVYKKVLELGIDYSQGFYFSEAIQNIEEVN